MDPNHWNTYQQYGRLQAPMPTTARLDLPLLEQAAAAGFATGGLTPATGLGSPPIPAHASLPAARFSLGYHALPAVSQYESAAAAQYKSVAEQARLNEQARYAAAVALAKSSLFNTDPHTMKEPAPIASAVPFSHAVPGFSESSAFSSSTSLHEPPPAHSGSYRQSTLQRSTYDPSHVLPEARSHGVYTLESRPRESPPVPPTAHSNSRYETCQLQQSTQPQRESCQQEAILHYQQAARVSASQPTYLESPPPTESSHSSHSNQRSYRASPEHHLQQSYHSSAPATHQAHQKKVSQMSYSAYSSPVSSDDYSPGLSSNLGAMNPGSRHQSDSRVENVSLQGISPASSHHQKLSRHDTNPASVRHLTPQHAQSAQVRVVEQGSPPVQQILTANSVSCKPPAQIQSTHSSLVTARPAQVSAVSVDNVPSPQLSMSQMPLPSSSPPNGTLPVQAVADSTTLPKQKKKRIRLRKKEKSSIINVQAEVDTAVSSITPVNSIIEQKLVAQSIAEQAAIVSAQLVAAAGGAGYETIDPVGLGLGNTFQNLPLMGRVETEPIFMTNTFGNAFVNPNDILNTNLSDVAHTLSNGLMHLEHDESYGSERKYKTKAEQKMMPVEVDDEFAHLVQEPVLLPDDSHIKARSCPGGVGTAPPTGAAPEQQAPPAAAAAADKSKSDDFQSSFLSFLQGKKPETLSSVTNQSISERPPMPKYIPDTRPIRRPEPPKRDSSEEEGPRRRSSQRVAVSAVTFSDDDDDSLPGTSSQVDRAVKSVLSALGGGDDRPASTATNALKLTIPKSMMKPAAKRRRSSRASRACKKKRPSYIDDGPVDDEIVLSDEAEEDEWMDEDEEEVKTIGGKAKSSSKGKGKAEVLPPREKSARKAKEKVEQKREERRKRKTSRQTDYSDDDDDDEPNFVALEDSTSSEKDYDSDKDPVWMPSAAEPEKRRYSDSDGDGKSRKRAAVRSKGRVTKSIGSTRRTSGTDVSGSRPAPVTAKTALKLPDAPYEALDPAFVHDYQRGDFVIDRKHLTNYDSYPIWKIDAGKLLQKYEPVQRDGKLCHSSLSTYSSWSEDIRKAYKAIKVKSINVTSQKEDLVQVLEDYRPKPPDEGTEEDSLMQPFNVYLQILLSQALEPGFLATIAKETDEDDYYKEPLDKLDNLLDEKKEKLFEKANFTPTFLETLKSHPYYFVTEHPSLNQPCQAMPDRGYIACKRVLFYGHPYVRDSLDGAEQVSEKTANPVEYSISLMASRTLPLCHCVHHYKFSLYKKCKTEVHERKEIDKKEQFSEVLDACLQDRTWVQQLFRDLRQMVDSCDQRT